MKKIKLFLILILLSGSFMVFAQGVGGRHGGGGVGAPLDGGLLALLAAGGITYYLRRKKNRQ